MTQTRFTPGPWFVGMPNEPGKATTGIRSIDWVLAEMCDDIGSDFGIDQEANAHLIAAAPLMYSELESAPRPSDLDFTNPEAFKREYKEWWERRNAALRTARGETQEQQS